MIDIAHKHLDRTGFVPDQFTLLVQRDISVVQRGSILIRSYH